MKKCRPRWTKIAIDWVERELTAVMAVAIVLAFIFTQSLATDEGTRQSLVSTTTIEEGITYQQQVSAVLWAGGNTIRFSRDIQGQGADASPVVWSGESTINTGDSLRALGAATVAFPATNGTFNLAVTFDGGTVTVNSVAFSSSTYTTRTKPVTVSNGTLTVGLSSGTQIYKIEATTKTAESGGTGGESILPISSITVIPASKIVVLNLAGTATFTPISFVRTSLGQTVDAQINWLSSDTGIATVDADGTVICKNTGTVTITATVAGTNLKASTSVNVLPPVVIPTVGKESGSAIRNQPAETSAKEGLLETFVRNLTQNRTTTLSTGGQAPGGTTTGVITNSGTGSGSGIVASENVLDAFAAAQATKLSNFGTTQLTQGELNAVINTTQNTATGKIVARARLAVAEIGQTLREIAVGRQVTMKDGTVAQKKSAAQLILNWIKNTFFGGVSATPLSATTPDNPVE